MIAIKLREAMEAYKRRTNEPMTYRLLAERTGIAKGTLQIIGSRDGYNATLELIEKLCHALDVPLHKMLEIIDDPPKPKRRQKKKRRPTKEIP